MSDPDVSETSAEYVYIPRRRASGYEEEEEPSLLWLLTFADVSALMLTFFVLLYSMSSLEEQQWENLTEGFAGGFDAYRSSRNFSATEDAIEITRIGTNKALDLSYIESLVTQMIADNQSLSSVVMARNAQRFIVSFPVDLIFPDGSSAVGLDGKRVVFALGDIFSRIRNHIEVVSYTSSGDGGRALALQQAASLADVLKASGYEKSVDLIAHSTSRLTYGDSAGSGARIDLMVSKHDGSRRLPGVPR